MSGRSSIDSLRRLAPVFTAEPVTVSIEIAAELADCLREARTQLSPTFSGQARYQDALDAYEKAAGENQ